MDKTQGGKLTLTIEEIRIRRLKLHGLINDRASRRAMFGEEPRFAGQLEAYQKQLVELQTEICEHGSRMGALCPDCGSLLPNANVFDQLNAMKLRLDDSTKWLSDDEMFKEAYPESS